jgi:Type II secretion system (T2SS), protein E, N-terminal domain
VDPTVTTAVPDAAAGGGPSAADAPSGEERTPLGALLVAEGFLNDVQLHQALHLGSQTGERLGEIVVRQGLASEEDVARLLADQWDLGYVDRASIWFDANALARLSREDAQRLEAMPTRVEDGRVVVAVAEPTEERLAALREVIGEDTVVVVVPKAALEAGLHSELLASNGQAAEKAAPPDDDPPPTAKIELEAPPGPADLNGSGNGAATNDDDLVAAIAAELPAYKQAKAQQAKPTKSRGRTRAAASPAAAPPEGPPAVQAAAGQSGGGGLAESIAQLIEAQIGAAAATPGAQDGAKLAELEQRIEQLEGELEANRAALAELGRHLKAIAGVLGGL